MAKNNIDVGKVRQLWNDVKKNITTENSKLIKAIEAFDKYIY